MAKKQTAKGIKPSITPLGDRILLKPISENEGSQTASGIILPETVDKERPQQGVVLKVGPGKRGDDGDVIPITVKEGDRVIFTKFGPDEVTVDDEEYLIVSESNILAVIE